MLRPGRFDRQIVVDRPDVRGREGILKVHSRKIPLENNVDLSIIAKGTPGFSGADLANMVNEVSGNPGGIAYIEKRDWDHGSRRLASIDKARAVMGYDPQTKLVDGLKKTNQWFVENKDRIIYLET